MKTFHSQTFVKAQHFNVTLYLWISQEQFYASKEPWNEDRIMAFEDVNGKMIAKDVLLSDLSDFQEC